MNDTHLLSLSQAAATTGYSRHDLREMVRMGRLYGLRIDGHWRIAPSDLARLSGRAQSDAASDPEALLAAIYERDRMIRQLQDEKLALTTRLGHLQARLTASEARLALIDAHQDALPLAPPKPQPFFAAPSPGNQSAAEEPGIGRPQREASMRPAAPIVPVHRGSTSATQRAIDRLSGLARLFRMA